MKDETKAYFKTADKLLKNAAKLYALAFYEDAGRNCYLAGMNAARGLIFEHGLKANKRHKTLYGSLSKALHDRDIHDRELTAFLPVMSNLKAIADYETGEATLTEDRVATAIKSADHFVKTIKKIASAIEPKPRKGRKIVP